MIILSDNIVNCDTVESFRTLIAIKDFAPLLTLCTPRRLIKVSKGAKIMDRYNQVPIKCQDWLLLRTIQINRFNGGIAIHRKERGRSVPSAEGRFLYGRKLLNKFISKIIL